MAYYTVSLVARTPTVTAGGWPTLAEVDRIRWAGLSYSDSIDGAPTMDVSAQVDGLSVACIARLRDLAATPCELWIYRDGVLVAAGPLISHTIQARTITLHGAGLRYYLTYTRYPFDIAVTTDYGQLIWFLLQVSAINAASYGNYGIAFAHLLAGSGSFATHTIRGVELKTLDEIISTLGDRDNGFEWYVDPPTRRLELVAPRRGADRSSSVFLDRRVLENATISQSVAAGTFGTVAYASSSGAAGELSATATDTAKAAAFGVAHVATRRTDVVNAATMTDHATRLLADSSTAKQTTSQNLIPVTGADVGDIEAGDVVSYAYDAGLGLVAFTPRIRTKRVSVGDDGRETLSVEFV